MNHSNDFGQNYWLPGATAHLTEHKKRDYNHLSLVFLQGFNWLHPADKRGAHDHGSGRWVSPIQSRSRSFTALFQSHSWFSSVSVSQFSVRLSSVSLWNVNKKRPLSTVKKAHGCHGDAGLQQPHWISSVAALQNSDTVASGASSGCESPPYRLFNTTHTLHYHVENTYFFSSLMNANVIARMTD